MARARQDNDLQIDADLAHQRREWRAEHIGWWLMALLLSGALLGLFGDGPVGKASVGEPAGLMVEYDRLQRSSAPTEWRLHIDAGLVRDDTVRVRFDQVLIDDIQIDSIVPEPREVVAGTGWTEFVFDVAPGADARVNVQFRPNTFGRRSGRVAAQGASPVLVDQFIYP